MWAVLGDELVDGVVAAQMHLRPARVARFLDASDWRAAVADVTRACQLWGGIADLLVPVLDGVAPELYRRLLFESELDGTVGTPGAAVAAHLQKSPPHRAPALLALAAAERDRLKEMEVCGVRAGDPWELAYLAALGTLPATPDPGQLNALMLPPDLDFYDVVRLRRVSAASPCAADLAARLRDRESFTPAGMALYRLRSRPARPTQSALDGWLHDRYAFARQNGSSIVVIYTPSSVADLCLAWNLRALHGWPAGLPLAVPAGSDTAATADAVIELLEGAGNGIMGWPILLTSATIGADALKDLAIHLTERHQTADPVEPEDVLRPARPPARTTTTTVAFESGKAIVATRSDRDRQDLAPMTRPSIRPDLRLTVELPMHPVPPVQSLHGGHSAVFMGGGCAVDADDDRLAEIRWPTGFTLLRAVARDHDVDAAPSASGRTAMALLRALGSLHDVAWLAHRPLLALLYKKAASSGMSWWKQRSTEQAAIVADATTDPQGALDRFLAAIDDVSVSHGGESAATVTFSEMCQVIGTKDAASAWLEWAERRAVLIRGATVKCPRCQHEGWRPLAEIAPPIACPGCGSSNERPFGETSMPFTYRLGEALRRAIENDSIYHLFVMRTLAYILDGAPDKVVGAHPGVDFVRDGKTAEADVVVLLASGNVIPVEVKSRSTGLREHDLTQLDALADWLAATSVVLATGDDDSQLGPLFLAAARGDSLPVRRLLTSDDWLAPAPIVTFGTRLPGPDVCQDDPNPQPRTKTAADYDAAFAARLAERAALGSVLDPTAAGPDSPKQA